MYILAGLDDNNRFTFFGPFPTEERAKKYAATADKDFNKRMRWSIQPLVVPHFVMPIRFVE